MIHNATSIMSHYKHHTARYTFSIISLYIMSQVGNHGTHCNIYHHYNTWCYSVYHATPQCRIQCGISWFITSAMIHEWYNILCQVFYHKCSTKICNATLYMMTYHKARRYLKQNFISCSISNNKTMIHDPALQHMPRGMSAMIHISWHRLNRCLGLCYCLTKSCRNLIILV